MVSDQEPRYRLKDSNGNIVGTLFAESDGTLKLQEGTSGNENEVSLDTDGTLNVERFSSGLEPNDPPIGGSLDTTYVNSTGVNLHVWVTIENQSGSSGFIDAQFRVDVGQGGLNKLQDRVKLTIPNGDSITMVGRVPAGAEYSVVNFGLSGADISSGWREWAER